MKNDSQKNKMFNKMDLYSDTDRIGDADLVLNDNDPADAEIEPKIIDMYPNSDFVFDDDLDYCFKDFTALIKRTGLNRF